MMGEVSLETKPYNILVQDLVKLLYYEHWTDKRKYFYAQMHFINISNFMNLF